MSRGTPVAGNVWLTAAPSAMTLAKKSRSTVRGVSPQRDPHRDHRCDRAPRRHRSPKPAHPLPAIPRRVCRRPFVCLEAILPFLPVNAGQRWPAGHRRRRRAWRVLDARSRAGTTCSKRNNGAPPAATLWLQRAGSGPLLMASMARSRAGGLLATFDSRFVNPTRPRAD
jgi:hypothetical protein